ncbi:peptidoglycan DD-metalloendopeptidase family protein [Escherichia coli]|nr:peptidoglycan DD-metalloendopeptidase family protein [Escherichia coli]
MASTIFGVHYSLRNFRICQTVLRRRLQVTGKAGVKTRYLHLNKILVTKGARVTRGGAIALSGNSGRSSGPHLHYELVINNNPVNSLAFRAAAPADNKLEQHAFAHARDYERYLD